MAEIEAVIWQFEAPALADRLDPHHAGLPRALAAATAQLKPLLIGEGYREQKHGQSAADADGQAQRPARSHQSGGDR